ncbi:hypothetical protein HanRHA438_Chr12g0533421 [Helianthus annuus]|nr:hypothetical protein HanRHA438_Chr12g0533421 [Helianthus annuus]
MCPHAVLCHLISDSRLCHRNHVGFCSGGCAAGGLHKIVDSVSSLGAIHLGRHSTNLHVNFRQTN